MSNDPIENPRHSVLGSKADAGEGCCNHGVLGRESHVAEQRVDEADTRRGPIQHRDDRLAQRRKVSCPALIVGPAAEVVGTGQLVDELARVVALEGCDISTGAESLARASQDDHTDVLVSRCGMRGLIDLFCQHVGPRIQILWTIEGHGGDPILDLVPNLLISHGA